MEIGVVDRKGEPYHARGGGPERFAGDHRDAAFNEKTLGESQGALRFVTDMDEPVESPARPCRYRSRRSEHVEEQVSPPLEQAAALLACSSYGLRDRD
jgi:hypothetical protein